MDGFPDRQIERTGQRAAFESWVELRLPGARRRAAARDLSVQGIGLALSGPLPAVAAEVVSEFALPGIMLPLALEGVVVWADAAGSRIGVRFREVDPGLAELLGSFVAGRL
jgi:hypothetical protein